MKNLTEVNCKTDFQKDFVKAKVIGNNIYRTCKYYIYFTRLGLKLWALVMWYCIYTLFLQHETFQIHKATLKIYF